MSESTKSREFSDGLEHWASGDIVSWKLHGGAMQMPGLPDHVYCFKAHAFGHCCRAINFVGIESKIMDYTEIPESGVDIRTLPSTLQQARLLHVEAAGGLGLVCLFVTKGRETWAVFANMENYDGVMTKPRILRTDNLHVNHNRHVWIKKDLIITKRIVGLKYYNYESLWNMIADKWGPIYLGPDYDR